MNEDYLVDKYPTYLINCNIDCDKKYYNIISATMDYLKDHGIDVEVLEIKQHKVGIEFITNGDESIDAYEVLNYAEHFSKYCNK